MDDWLVDFKSAFSYHINKRQCHHQLLNVVLHGCFILYGLSIVRCGCFTLYGLSIVRCGCFILHGLSIVRCGCFILYGRTASYKMVMSVLCTLSSTSHQSKNDKRYCKLIK